MNSVPKQTNNLIEQPKDPAISDAPQTIQRWDTKTLFAGESLIEITHRGDIYRLQITRQGKLILTK